MASAGACTGVKPATVLAALLLAAPAVATAQTPDRVTVSVPAMAADAAINRLAAQLRVDVVTTIDLSRRRTRPLSGRYSAEEAFTRLLTPLDARAVMLRPGLYRVEAATTQRPAPRPSAPTTPTELTEVIVTGAIPRGQTPDLNGQSVIRPEMLARVTGAGAVDAVANLSATVESTRQGSGRNKLFIRGVADSTVSGPLQTTIGQYLGDFRLSYSAPDPDMALIDLDRIEVFEGPQGARFGSDSIGGVVRLRPTPPDPQQPGANLSAGLSLVRDGAPGGFGQVVLNQPVTDRAAVRLAAWTRREGGFIRNPVRGVDHADSIDSQGARLSARVSGDDWTLDALALSQTLDAGDAQLVRHAAWPVSDRPLAEPYSNDFSLAGLSFNRRGAGWRLSTAASVSEQRLHETFDASVPELEQLAKVERNQSVTAFSSETRLEADLHPRLAVSSGLSIAFTETDVVRSRTYLSPPFSADPPSRLRRRFNEMAVFGEVVWRPVASLRIMAGGRIAGVRIDNRLAGQDPDVPEIDTFSRSESILSSPLLGLRWSLSTQVAVFGRLEQGVRPAGASEAFDHLGPSYRADRLTLHEAGLTWSAPDDRWRMTTSAGLIDWRDIQSDVITNGGDLVTANIGDGEIAFVQLKGAWRPHETLFLSGSLFLNESRLTLAGFGTIGVAGGEMPNVAPASGQMTFEAGPFPLLGRTFSAGLDLRYVGRSRPGLGAVLSTPQGGYLNTDLSLRLGDDRRSIVLQASNLLDVNATRFGIGSLYRLSESYVAPVRPRTLQIGFEARF